MLCAIDFSNLHSILRSLYDEMMPLCSDMAGVAQGIAGLGALFYVAYRIWQALSRAEPVDVFPLLRPFAIGFCIMFFPTVVLGTINSVMSPIVQGTASMLEGQTLDMKKYREEKDRLEYEQMMRDPSTAYLVDDAEFDRQIDELGVTEVGTAAGMYIERGMYKVKKAIQNFFRELLEMLFQAASLTIDTIRTFFSRRAGDTRADSLCNIGVGRIPEHPSSSGFVDTYRPTYGCLWLTLFNHTGENTGAHASKRYFGTD